MRLNRKISIIILILLCNLNVIPAMAIEEAKYDVLEKDGSFEIRRYYPLILAETFVSGDFKDVGNIGFRRLFDFISGENLKNEPIEMTAPVGQEKQGQKIEMTAPVNMQNKSGTYRITFMMPSSYTLETLPRPLDENVKLRKEDVKIVAAYRYSGTWSKKRFEKMKNKLLSILESKKIEPSGEPAFARYNSPFMPWMFRRNEILVDVVYQKK